MKITDLQIEDLVMLGDNIYKIDEISANGWIFISEFKTNMGLTTTDEIINRVKPIPLTTEIFEKNGFTYEALENESCFIAYYISEDRRVKIYDMTNSGYGYWNVHVDNEDFSTIGSCDVRYVHEMQHLLRLCKYEMNIVV